MTDWQRELAGILEEECRRLERLAGLAGQKTPALQSGNTAEIESFTGREQPLLRELAALEKRRLRLLDAHGVSGRPLRELAETAEGSAAERLRELLPRLSEAAGRLRECSRLNGELVRLRLEWSNRFLRAVAPARQMYDSRGAESRSDQPLGLVDRIV